MGIGECPPDQGSGLNPAIELGLAQQDITQRRVVVIDSPLPGASVSRHGLAPLTTIEAATMRPLLALGEEFQVLRSVDILQDPWVL